MGVKAALTLKLHSPPLPASVQFDLLAAEVNSGQEGRGLGLEVDEGIFGGGVKALGGETVSDGAVGFAEDGQNSSFQVSRGGRVACVYHFDRGAAGVASVLQKRHALLVALRERCPRLQQHSRDVRLARSLVGV